MTVFFDDATPDAWQLALNGYSRVLATQSKERLPSWMTRCGCVGRRGFVGGSRRTSRAMSW